MTPCRRVRHPEAVSTSFRTIVGAAEFQSSDLVQRRQGEPALARGSRPARAWDSRLEGRARANRWLATENSLGFAFEQTSFPSWASFLSPKRVEIPTKNRTEQVDRPWTEPEARIREEETVRNGIASDSHAYPIAPELTDQGAETPRVRGGVLLSSTCRGADDVLSIRTASMRAS